MRTITTPMLLPWLLAVAAFFSPLWGQNNASVLVIQGGTLIDGSGAPPVANEVIVIDHNPYLLEKIQISATPPSCLTKTI